MSTTEASALSDTSDGPGGDAGDDTGNRSAVPPARRGSRDERREATLRSLAAGEVAGCAYCGRVLPPIPPQGGRPTPYCPADPDRYGRWGAKVISCAMLDEQREIWVSVYGPDQPMTVLDTQALDQHLAGALSALAPLNAEISALRTHVTEQTAAALTARQDADARRDEALEQARAAQAERDTALAQAQRATAEAERARQQSDADRRESRTALETTTTAIEDRDAAVAARDLAEAERQRALEQVSTTQDRVTALQAELAGAAAAALDRLDTVRRDAAQARQDLRTALTTEHETQLRAQADDFAQRARDIQDAADHRVAELAGQLAETTRSYTTTVAPLHEQLGALRAELTTQTTTLTELRRQHDTLRAALTNALDTAPELDQLRHRITAAMRTDDPGQADTAG